MRLTEFLGAELSTASSIVWVDSSPDALLDPPLVPDGVSVVEVDAASAADFGKDVLAVLLLEVDASDGIPPSVQTLLSGRPPGARTVLVTHSGIRDPAALGDALASARQRVVHVARLNPSSSGALEAALSVETGGEGGEGQTLRAINATRLAASPLSEMQRPDPDHAELLRLSAALKDERRAGKNARSRAEALEARLARTEADLRRVRESTALQFGRAISRAVREPRRGLPALPVDLLRALLDRRRRRLRPPHDPGLDRSTAAGGEAPVTARPEPAGRRRQFDLALPDLTRVPDAPTRRPNAPRRLHFNVPYSFFIPLRLERDGLAGYEPETLAWWLALCDVAPRGDAWDVGANTGLFATLAAATGTRDVVAFEPTPELAWWARRSARDNGLNFVTEQIAASDTDGTATFFLSDSTDSSSSLAEGFRQSSHRIDVITERLDGYAGRTGRFPSVLKIDTETTEPAVLRGAETLVRAHRPWILVEVLANCGVEEPLAQMARDWGYRWFHLTDQVPPPEPAEIAGDPTFTYFMYLLAPAELDEDLLARVRAWRAELATCGPLTP
ncbi:hypothetical protein GCM10027039_16840 [Terrabacter koreensis]